MKPYRASRRNSASYVFMLPTTSFGDRGIKVFLLHWLSGSARVWTEMGAILAERGLQCVALDLPGFGDASNVSGFNVQAMSDAVIESISALRAGHEDEPWLLAGHSMGGKIATVVARAAVDRHEGLRGLRGMILFSPSPPGPEPMKESKREQMLHSLGESTGDVDEDRRRAAKYVDNNTGKLPLLDAVRERAVDDVLRMNRTAFRAWLEHGSKEDWRERVGVLPLRSVIFAGTEDAELGPDAQRDVTLPYFEAGEVVTLQGAGHLAPMERPREMSERVCEFVCELGLPLKNESRLTQSFKALIRSERTSEATRTVMDERLAASADWNHRPRVLSDEEFRSLRALAACVVPDAGFDAAALIEAGLASGHGNGWRFAQLPVDADAWKRGLYSLDAAAQREFAVNFLALHDAQRDALLRKAHEGELGKGVLGRLHVGDGANAYSAAEMKLWFEEVRAEFAKHYMAHPKTMERVGFTGFADERGFTQIRLGEREEFER